MDKLKDGNSSYRQALTWGDPEDWVVYSCFCSQLPGARLALLSTAGAPRGRRLRSMGRSASVASKSHCRCPKRLIYFLQMQCLTVPFAFPLQAALGSGSGRQWSWPRQRERLDFPCLCAEWLRWRPLSLTQQLKLTTSDSSWLPRPPPCRLAVPRATATPTTSSWLPTAPKGKPLLRRIPV